jgi:hypothetical protein
MIMKIIGQAKRKYIHYSNSGFRNSYLWVLASVDRDNCCGKYFLFGKNYCCADGSAVLFSLG